MRTNRPTAVLSVAALACAGLAVTVESAAAGTPSPLTVAVGGPAKSYQGSAPGPGLVDPLGPPAPTCTAGCDQEAVTVTAPQGYASGHTISLTAKLTATGSDAYDIGIIDSSGTLVASQTGVASGGSVTAAKIAPGTYTIEADGDTATGTSFTMTMTATGAAKAVQRSVPVGPLTFSRETVSDPFRLGTEPNIAIAPDNKTVYESPIFGFSTTQSFLSRSADGGQTFKNLSFLPGVGKLDECTGGGDSDLATDQFSGDLFMIDLGGAPEVPYRVSNDQGQTFHSACDANQQNGPNVFTDRQWLSTDYVNKKMWFIYRDGLLTPPSTGAVGGVDVSKQAYGEYIKSSPLPTAAGTAGDAQLQFTSLCNTVGGVATPCNNDVMIAGNAITDNGDAAHGGTSKYAGTTYVAEQTAKGIGVMIIDPRSSTPFTQSIIPGSKAQILFPTVAVDKAGTIYETWSDSTTAQIEYALSKDRGKTWTKPVVINGAPAATTVMPWVVAGDKGRVDVVFYGTANTVAPTTNYGPWYAYMLQSLNADATSPSFTQNVMTDRPNHIDPICLSGLGCTTDTGPGGDRELGDFFKVVLDADGRALVSFADGDNQLGTDVAGGPQAAPSFGHFVRQATGPSLLAKVGSVSPVPIPSNSVSAAEHTAPLPLQEIATGAVGSNAPSEVLRASATSIGNDGNVHVQVRADDLSAALPATSLATTATYLTRWVYKDHVYFGSAENTQGQWSFFGGEAAPVTDGAAIKYAAYPSTHAVAGKVTGNTIDLTIPVALVGKPARTATLYSVTSYALAATAPTPPGAETALGSVAAPTFPQIGDVLPAYNTELGGAAIPGVPGTGTGAIPPGTGTTPGQTTTGTGSLAVTGLAAWHSWLALGLLVAAAGFGGAAVRLRRRS